MRRKLLCNYTANREKFSSFEKQVVIMDTCSQKLYSRSRFRNSGVGGIDGVLKKHNILM